MIAARLRNAAPFLAAGLAAGSAAFLGYQAHYSTGKDMNCSWLWYIQITSTLYCSFLLSRPYFTAVPINGKRAKTDQLQQN